MGCWEWGWTGMYFIIDSHNWFEMCFVYRNSSNWVYRIDHASSKKCRISNHIWREYPKYYSLRLGTPLEIMMERRRNHIVVDSTRLWDFGTQSKAFANILLYVFFISFLIFVHCLLNRVWKTIFRSHHNSERSFRAGHIPDWTMYDFQTSGLTSPAGYFVHPSTRSCATVSIINSYRAYRWLWYSFYVDSFAKNIA